MLEPAETRWARRNLASRGSTGWLPGGGAGGGSSHTGRLFQISRPAPGRDLLLPLSMPSASSTASPQLHRPRAMASAVSFISDEARAAMSSSSSSSARASSGREATSCSGVVGTSRPSVSHRPRTVGRQKRAGRTKAKSSSRSCAGRSSSPSRAATAGAWQTSGRVPAARRPASAPDSRSVVPSGARHSAPRAVATKAGQEEVAGNVTGP